jgi:hypothetical protein
MEKRASHPSKSQPYGLSPVWVHLSADQHHVVHLDPGQLAECFLCNVAEIGAIS